MFELLLTADMQARMRHLEALDAEQRRQGLPAAERYCLVPPQSGRFLALLASMAPPGRAVEIGSSVGYSAIWLWLGRRGRGPLETYEQADWKIALAQETFRLTGLSDEVDLICGDARQTLPRRDRPDVAFAFLDAWHGDYVAYYETLVSLMLPGGVITADNVDSHRHELEEFLEHVERDPRVDSVVVPIGKGILFARKKPDAA
jgi:predicted O-methyltransferase YrrM